MDVACGKFYIGIPLGLGIWWYFAEDRRVRWQVVALMVVMWLTSFVVYPNWVGDLLQRWAEKPPLTDFQISSWQYTGPAVLLLWLPVLLSHRKDYRWWTAAWVLTTPYIHIHGLTHLLIHPVGWLGLIVQVPFFTGLTHSPYLLLLPLVIYALAWRDAWGQDPFSAWLMRQRQTAVVEQTR